MIWSVENSRNDLKKPIMDDIQEPVISMCITLGGRLTDLQRNLDDESGIWPGSGFGSEFGSGLDLDLDLAWGYLIQRNVSKGMAIQEPVISMCITLGGRLTDLQRNDHGLGLSDPKECLQRNGLARVFVMLSAGTNAGGDLYVDNSG